MRGCHPALPTSSGACQFGRVGVTFVCVIQTSVGVVGAAFMGLVIVACSSPAKGPANAEPPATKPAGAATCDECQSACKRELAMCTEAVGKLTGDNVARAIYVCMGEGITPALHKCIVGAKTRRAAWQCEKLGAPKRQTACIRCQRDDKLTCPGVRKYEPVLQPKVWLKVLTDKMCACKTEACARATIKETKDTEAWREGEKAVLQRYAACEKRLMDPVRKRESMALAYRFEAFADKMCACKDAVCGKRVYGAMDKWTTALFKSGTQRGTKKSVKRWKAAQRRLFDCYMTTMKKPATSKMPQTKSP